MIECVKYIGRGRLWFGSAKPLPGQRVRCKSQKSLYEFCLSSRVKMERTIEPGDHLALRTWEGSHNLYCWAPAGQSVVTAHQPHFPCQHPTYTREQELHQLTLRWRPWYLYMVISYWRGRKRVGENLKNQI